MFFAVVAGVLALTLGSLDARAGQIALPTTLDQLLPAGNFAVLSTPPSSEADTFSNFTFSSSAIPPTTPVLVASQVGVAQFHVGAEDGLEFSGAFFAPAGTTVDYKISYVVTAPANSHFTDAFLGVTYNLPGGTTGTVSVGESLFNNANGAPLGSLSVSAPPGTIGDTINVANVNSILVKKDILLVGGSLSAGVSIIDQGFSSISGRGGMVPEPTSMALLGIGLSGLLTLRRFLRRNAVA
jgi:hypothetical protein